MSSQTIAVIGGGPGGLRAAQAVAELGGSVVVIEQRDFLGGTPIAEKYCGLTPRGEPAQPQIRQMIEQLTINPRRDPAWDRARGHSRGAGSVRHYAAGRAPVRITSER